ncbi:MAG: small basic family protein [Fimbriimonadales bacterium]
MIAVPLLALVIGCLLAYFAVNPSTPLPREYIGVASLTGLDTLFGGIRAALETRFRNELFLTGFVFNILLALGLVYLGTKIGVEMYLAAVVTLGGRLFLNLSIIRRHYLTRMADARDRRTMEANQS